MDFTRSLPFSAAIVIAFIFFLLISPTSLAYSDSFLISPTYEVYSVPLEFSILWHGFASERKKHARFHDFQDNRDFVDKHNAYWDFPHEPGLKTFADSPSDGFRNHFFESPILRHGYASERVKHPRFHAFQDNRYFVDARGLNAFGDLPSDGFRNPTMFGGSYGSIPPSLDRRNNGAVTSVKDQGSSGYGSENGVDDRMAENFGGKSWGMNGDIHLLCNSNDSHGMGGINMSASFPTITSPNRPPAPPPDPTKCSALIYCRSGSTCCCNSRILGLCRSWSCCELENAVCCKGGRYCCPHDYPICDTSGAQCLKQTGNITVAIRATERKTSSFSMSGGM